MKVRRKTERQESRESGREKEGKTGRKEDRRQQERKRGNMLVVRQLGKKAAMQRVGSNPGKQKGGRA